MVVQSENEEKFEYTGGVTSVREFLSLRPSHHTYTYPHTAPPPPSSAPKYSGRAYSCRATSLLNFNVNF